MTDRLTKYTPTDLQITSVLPTPFIEPTLTERKYYYSEETIRKNRDAQNRHNSVISTIHIEDEQIQNSLFAQAISAVNRYPRERREMNRNFKPFAYFTEPNGSRFLVGDIEGIWNLEDDSFELRKILIHHVCNTREEMQNLMNTVQSLNPGVPKVSSDSFETAFKETSTTTSI